MEESSVALSDSEKQFIHVHHAVIDENERFDLVPAWYVLEFPMSTESTEEGCDRGA